MNELTFNKDIAALVDSISDTSDNFMNRALIKFKNGYALSVIRSEYSYGGEQGLFEIAPLGVDGDFIGSSLLAYGEDVIGYCSPEEVNKHMLTIGRLNPGIKNETK